jgi:lysophospholipase L1-like esterase
MAWTTARWTLGAIGTVLLAAALAPGSLGVGDARGFGATQLAAVVIGIAALGAAVAWRRFLSAYRTGAALLLNTLLLLASCELGAALVLLRLPAPERDPIPGETSAYYRDKPWAAAYWREFHSLRQAYHPYFLWRARPFHGRLINIDADGLRETPGARCARGAYQVDAFGGSTLWGWGEPDSATLGAHLQAELAQGSPRPVCVRNFAQLGSNTTQDLIQLLRELQAGRVPDLVVFYSGVNDIIPPFGYGRAGTHFDLRTVSDRLERGLEKRQPRPELRDWLAASSLWRLASRVGSGTGGEARPARTPVKGGPFVSDALADSIVSTFVANVVALEAIAARYGFRHEVFWQPNALIGPKPLTPEEQAMRTRERIAPLIDRVYSRIGCVAPRYEHIHDLTGAFAHEPGLFYLDWNHVNSPGNRVIARAMARTIALEDKRDSVRIRPPPSPPLPAECLSRPAPEPARAQGSMTSSRAN